MSKFSWNCPTSKTKKQNQNRINDIWSILCEILRQFDLRSWQYWWKSPGGNARSTESARLVWVNRLHEMMYEIQTKLGYVHIFASVYRIYSYSQEDGTTIHHAKLIQDTKIRGEPHLVNLFTPNWSNINNAKPGGRFCNINFMLYKEYSLTSPLLWARR